MLFTSPMFAFLFLPATVLLFMAFAKSRRRIWFFAICVLFYVLLNLHTPWLLFFYPILILYTWFGGKAILRYRRSWFIFSICVIPYLSLILFRSLAHQEGGGFAFFLGMTVACMNTTSYLLESVRGNIKQRNRLFDLCRYLLFFPTMIVGPVIKYPEFLRLTEEDRIDPSVKNLSEGALLFAGGFVKRIAVGAVLTDAYGVMLERFGGAPDLTMGIFLLFLLYFGVFFSITGYSDMGCGIARMYGIRLRHTHGNPFRAYLPDVYSRSLFSTLHEWLDDYVVCPLMRLSGGRFAHLIHSMAYGGCLLLIVRPQLFILLLAIPSVGMAYLSSRFRLEERLSGRAGVRLLTTAPTMIFAAVGWIFITMGDISSVLSYVSRITADGSEYYTDLILATLSGSKYLLLLFMGVVLLLPAFAQRFLSCRRETLCMGLEGAYMAVILLLFVLTVFFFLPGFSCYDFVPFRYVYL